MPLGTVKLPTLEQLEEVAEDLGFTMSEEDLETHLEAMVPRHRRLQPGRPAARRAAAGEVSAHARLPPGGRGEPVRRLVRTRAAIEGAAARQAQGQAGRAQGQRLPRRRADDERRLDARGLRARRRRHHRRRASSTPAAPSSARRSASTSASRAAATPARPARCTTRARWATRPAARPRAARPWSPPARSTMAIGGDQGGSIRMPAAYCGIYGMKPTHGLVPYTGIMPIELTHRPHRSDDRHGRRQRAAARGAGRPRRARPAPVRPAQTERYTEALGRGRGGPAGSPSSTRASAIPSRSRPSTRWCARRADELQRLGAEVDEVSIPMHRLGPPIWLPIAVEGATMQMMQGNGYGFNWKGLYVTSLHRLPQRLADQGRRALRHAQDHDAARPLHGEATIAATTTPRRRTSSRRLRAAYDAVLKDYDLLLMPTLPLTATPLPDDGRADRRRSCSGRSRCCPTPRPSTAPTTRR